MMTNIPASLRDKLSSEYEFTYLEEVKRLIDMLEQLKEDNKKDPN